ncbi:hypothetical protein MSAN_01817300 [Mycena sanguinolenta]|uniref:Uncharacterized protein n=1 Tax=Mycena sanguinolenta TaxID=230812 RepID=A0A8H6XT93_9AGAR|nr:hypothetical protein MSAN_01817300 [Mycena sanguinolenta]
MAQTSPQPIHDLNANATTVTEPTQQAATSPDQTATEPPVEHKKHGIGAIIEKIAHPSGHHDHTHSHTDIASVPVAVPKEASDGQAHLAPAGNAVGGIL